MARGTTRNGLTRVMAFCLLCLTVWLGMLVASGRAWAQEAPAEAGQNAATGIVLARDDASALLVKTDAQAASLLLAQDSDSTPQDNGIPVLRLSIDPAEYQKMVSSPT